MLITNNPVNSNFLCHIGDICLGFSANTLRNQDAIADVMGLMSLRDLNISFWYDNKVTEKNHDLNVRIEYPTYNGTQPFTPLLKYSG